MELVQPHPARMRPAQVIVTVFFAALLATPWVYRRADPQRSAVAVPNSAKLAMADYGFYLKESSAAAGIHFGHTSPHLDAKLDHIMQQVASMGAAVSIVDFDRDG